MLVQSSKEEMIPTIAIYSMVAFNFMVFVASIVCMVMGW
jgi:hypothetical protein